MCRKTFPQLLFGTYIERMLQLHGTMWHVSIKASLPARKFGNVGSPKLLEIATCNLQFAKAHVENTINIHYTYIYLYIYFICVCVYVYMLCTSASVTRPKLFAALAQNAQHVAFSFIYSYLQVLLSYISCYKCYMYVSVCVCVWACRI